jgi:hypothetical protein
MRAPRVRFRAVLFAGASAIALTVGSQNARAADLPPWLPTKAPPAIPEPAWTWWIEGGAFNTAGKAPNTSPVPVGEAFFPGIPGTIPGFGGFGPNWGAEGAIGFDWQPQGLGPWHLSGEFRYGSAKSSTKPYAAHFGPASATTASGFGVLGGAATANQQLREEHWALDFAVGREFGFGGSKAQWNAGIRVADLRATLTANGNFAGTAAFTGHFSPFSFSAFANIAGEQTSKFLGAGPRLSVEGETPLAGSWAVDWKGGAAVLIGDRQLDQTISISPPPFFFFTRVVTSTISSSSTGAVFNPDGELGLSYLFNSNAKLTAGYRVDAYFNALRTFNAAGNIVDVDRIYDGPFLRLTTKF